MRERERKNRFEAFVHLGVAKACETVLPNETPNETAVEASQMNNTVTAKYIRHLMGSLVF